MMIILDKNKKKARKVWFIRFFFFNFTLRQGEL